MLKSNKKLSYFRETARQLHTSFCAREPIVQFTEHRGDKLLHLHNYHN